ncbi:MAG: 30S ribosomal protein S7 [Candidatus Micrarchaeia archaeon]
MAKVFGKYDFEGITINDESLKQYISLSPLSVPHSHGRHAKKPFGKEKLNIVERLVNKMMRGGTGEKMAGKVIRTHGRLQGKKFKAMRVVEEAFDIIAKKSNQNPIQILVNALENTAPREDTTRVRYGGVSYQVAVDVSAERRLDMALRNVTLAAIMGSFDKEKTLAQALADELMLAAKGDVNSYAIKKKDEAERIARSAR